MSYVIKNADGKYLDANGYWDYDQKYAGRYESFYEATCAAVDGTTAIVKLKSKPKKGFYIRAKNGEYLSEVNLNDGELWHTWEDRIEDAFLFVDNKCVYEIVDAINNDSPDTDCEVVNA